MCNSVKKMIAAISSKNLKNIVISTGNILNSSNKLGSTVIDEVKDGLEATLKDGESHTETMNNQFCVLRGTMELEEKLSENVRTAINIGVKLFLKENSSTQIDMAVSTLLGILKIKYIDSLVLSNLKSFNDFSSGDCFDSLKIGLSAEDCKSDESQTLKSLWNTLEKLTKQEKILQLGIADVSMETLSELHKTSEIPPSIAQINISTCCKVPEEMQEFCNHFGVQLLTHSDTEDILANDFIIPDFKADWILRYQIHLRCRGVLIAKGYVLGASKIAS